MNISSKFKPACFGPFTSYFFIFLCQTPWKMWLNIKVSSETWYSTHQEPVYNKWTYNKSPTTLQAGPFLLVDHTTKSIQHYHHQKWTLSIQMIVMRFSQQCWPFSLLAFQVTWGWRYVWDIIRRWNLQPRCHWSNDLINMVNQWVLLHARKWLFMLSAKIWTLSANVICKL